MKSLFKVTLLATTMALALNATQVMAADAAKGAETPAPVAAAPAATDTTKFKSDDEQAAYALGASLGRYMDNSLKEQEKLGIKLDKDQYKANMSEHDFLGLLRSVSWAS